MRGLKYVPVALLLLAAVALGAPPEVPAEVVAPQDKVREIVVQVPDGKTLQYRTVGDKVAFREMKASAKGEAVFWLVSETGGRSHVVWWFKGEDESAVTNVNGAVAPAPPNPAPTPPNPAPDEKPKPVASFRVFVVFESADNLTAAQRGVIYGRAVEDWLNANCTTGNKGWRRRDKDAPGESDPTLAALWAAVQPAITVTPCVAVEVNGKVDLIPLEATPAAMVAKLQTYRGK